MNLTDDIDQMEAGRGLDALVAREVMGWKPSEISDETTMGYSTYIAAAWEVVDAVANRCDETITVNIHVLYPSSGDVPQTWVEFNDVLNGFPGPAASADSVQLAICRAALKACRELAKSAT